MAALWEDPPSHQKCALFPQERGERPLDYEVQRPVWGRSSNALDSAFGCPESCLMGDDSSAIALHRIIPVTGRQLEAPAPAPPNDLERTAAPPRARTAVQAVA